MRANYLRVLATFLRNSLVREMMFRSNFLLTLVTRAAWFGAQIALFEMIFGQLGPSGTIGDWQRADYFAFMATGMLINSLIETLFMPNCANFSEQIRTGNLDFVLLKPIDPQFLVSTEKIDLANLNHTLLALGLLGYALTQVDRHIGPWNVILYVLLIVASVTFLYSLMISLAATSIWFGRNQGLYDFWFYITIFARYPQQIYQGSPAADVLRFAFSYVLPILLVVTVPARELLAMTLSPSWLTPMLIAGAGIGFLASRLVFDWSLKHYCSASS